MISRCQAASTGRRDSQAERWALTTNHATHPSNEQDDLSHEGDSDLRGVEGLICAPGADGADEHGRAK